MKNSFFLVIPAQQQNPELLATYEKAVVNQWVSELPSANPSLATRLLYDFIEGINSVQMPPQQRLEVLEILRPHFLTIEDYLRSRGVELEILNSPECIQLMGDFIKEKSELWNEDIGD